MSEDPIVVLSGVWKLSQADRRVLALALLDRPNRVEDGEAALRNKYPLAPEAMIHTATHHVYVDGPEAVMDFLADAELAIREPSHELDYGVSSHLLDHVYNWLQFRMLLPDARGEMLTLLEQIEEAVKDDDRAYLLASVREFRELLDGNKTPPDFELS